MLLISASMRVQYGFLLSVVFLTGLYAYAQNPVTDSIQLQAVEIKGKRPTRNLQSAAVIQILSAARIKGIAGSSAADAIKAFSGVTLRDYGGIGGLKTVMVRSLSAHHTAVFIDGMAVSDLASGQVDLGKLPLAGIEEISMRIGSNSVLCQPAKTLVSASSINLQSKTMDFGNKKINFFGGLKAGSFGFFNPFLIAGYKLGPKTNLVSTLNTRLAHGQYQFIINNLSHSSTARRKNADIEASQFTLLLDHTTKDSSRLKILANYYDSERGLPGAVIFYNPYSKQRLWNKDLYTGIQYKNPASGKIQSLSNLAYSRSFLKYLDPEYANNAGKLETRFEQQEFYISQAMSLKTTHKLELGVSSDLMVHTLESDQYKYQNPFRLNWLTAISTRLRLRQIEVQGNILTSLVRNKTESGKAEKTRLVLNPGFEFLYKLRAQPDLGIRLLYKKTTRMPTFNDLYYSFTGNTGLRPELASQINLGLLFEGSFRNIGRVSISADGFYNSVQDKIVAIPTQQLFVWSTRNIGLVDIRGIELQFDGNYPFSINTDLSLLGNYTLQYATDRTHKGSITYKHQIAYIPFETANASLIFRHRQITVSHNVLFSGFRYSLGQNIAANAMPAFWNHDLTIDWHILTETLSYRFKGQISNLLNKQYEVIRGFPMPGRAIYITLEINY